LQSINSSGEANLEFAPEMPGIQIMSEEQPTFKVTDRRLFNADGSPRALENEAAADNNPSLEQPTEVPTPTEPRQAQAPAAEHTSTEFADEEMTEEELAGAKDPASFLNFLMSIASNAASSLGMMEHPVTQERNVDLELAKHWIDVLGMLQRKTQGNLTASESKMLEGLLADLRMQFVSLANAGDQTPRAFSGRDITGGR